MAETRRSLAPREPAPAGSTVDATDIDGDGTIDMITTTTVTEEPVFFKDRDGVVVGTRTVEVEVSELRSGERSVTVTEWIEADTDGDGDLDLVSHSERSGIDHDQDGTPDLVTEIVREGVVVDGHVVHSESQRTE